MISKIHVREEKIKASIRFDDRQRFTDAGTQNFVACAPEDPLGGNPN
jgi:hypothetical protein